MKEAENRNQKDFINERYGLNDLDHDTALESGHIYDLMESYKDHCIASIKESDVFDIATDEFAPVNASIRVWNKIKQKLLNK